MKKIAYIFVVLSLLMLTGCEPPLPPLYSSGDVVTVNGQQVCIVVSVFNGNKKWRYTVVVRDKQMTVNEDKLQLVTRFDWNQEVPKELPQAEARGEIEEGDGVF